MSNKNKKKLNILWLIITIIAVLSMVSFLFIPLLRF